MYFDVTGTVETKIRALKAHASQMQFTPANGGEPSKEEREFGERLTGWLKDRGAQKGIPYAESFKYFYLG